MDQSILSNPKAQATIGFFTLLTNFLASWFHEVFPIITTLGALAGSFLAIHGSIKVISNWIKRVDNKIHHLPDIPSSKD